LVVDLGAPEKALCIRAGCCPRRAPVDAGQLKIARDRTYPLEQAVESRESA
jgi:hypothetical protein